jgi:hypothetical protein
VTAAAAALRHATGSDTIPKRRRNILVQPEVIVTAWQSHGRARSQSAARAPPGRRCCGRRPISGAPARPGAPVPRSTVRPSQRKPRSEPDSRTPSRPRRPRPACLLARPPGARARSAAARPYIVRYRCLSATAGLSLRLPGARLAAYERVCSRLPPRPGPARVRRTWSPLRRRPGGAAAGPGRGCLDWDSGSDVLGTWGPGSNGKNLNLNLPS